MITQREIAERAGVSSSLVSRVLSNKVRHIVVSEEKISQINRLAEEMGYEKSILNNRTGSIGGRPLSEH